MSFIKGQWVKHPQCPSWGMGQVLEDRGDSVRVLFQVGEKIISQRFVTLEHVAVPTGTIEPGFILPTQSTIKIESIKDLCLQFHSEMKDNRSGTNDGGMALKVIHDLEVQGQLSKGTAGRLFAWCHTDRPVYLRGVNLAQRICG